MALFLNSFWINLDQQFPNYLQLVDIYYDTILVFTKSELSLSFFSENRHISKMLLLYPGWKAAMPLIVSDMYFIPQMLDSDSHFICFFYKSYTDEVTISTRRIYKWKKKKKCTSKTK